MASSLTRPSYFRNITSNLAAIPAWLVLLVAYGVSMGWTIWISFTSSRVMPVNEFVGLRQYERLWGELAWTTALTNIFIYSVLSIAGSLILGFLLAVAIDQRIRAEGVFRTIFLYPYAMSLIVTGLAWKWIMDPTLGLGKVTRDFGMPWLSFDWLVKPDTALYVVIAAAIWQTSGFVMAILLAGLRGIDGDLMKAARLDGIPLIRFYLYVVIPELRALIVAAAVLLTIGAAKVYDLVVALTGGGPGLATEVPARFIMVRLFLRQSIGQAAAASTIMLLIVLLIALPWIYFQYIRTPKSRGEKS